MSSYTNNIDQNNFYFNGLIEKKINQLKCTKNLNDFIKKMDALNLCQDINWKQSYQDTFDLNQDMIIKNDFFINFLFEQNIPQYLESITGHKLYLGDVVLRKTYLKEKSYMDWHRDTYLKNGSAVGRTPPLIKIIYYPDPKNCQSLELEIIKGSHIQYFQNKFIQKFQQFFSKRIKIYSSNTKFLIFNSAIMHAAKCPKKDGAFRLIYNFCSESQLSQFEKAKLIHLKYMELITK